MFIFNNLYYEIVKYKFIITYVFIIGIVAHGFAFFNTNFSHDSLSLDHTYSINLGRWMQNIIFYFRGKSFPPVLIGFLSLTAVSLSAIIYCSVFKITNKIHILLVCGLLVTNFSLSYITATYLFFLDINCISLLLSIFSIYIICNTNIILVLRILISSIILCSSIALYQCYLQVYCTFCVLLLIHYIIRNEQISKIFKTFFYLLIVVVFASLFYYLSLKFLKYVLRVEFFDGYNSINNTTLDLNILTTYKNIFFDLTHLPTYSTLLSKTIYYLSIFLSIIIFVLFNSKNKKHILNSLLCIFIAVVILPLSANCIYNVSGGLMHSLMKYSYSLVFLLPINLLSILSGYKTKSNISSYFNFSIIFLFLSLIFSNIIFSNQFYLKKDYIDKATLSFVTRIYSKLENLDGYSNDTPVCLVGSYENNPNIIHYDFLETSEYNINTGINYEFSFTYSFYTYVNNILKFKCVYCTLNEDSLESDLVKKMPIFPMKGSVVMFKENAIIKLSD